MVQFYTNIAQNNDDRDIKSDYKRKSFRPEGTLKNGPITVKQRQKEFSKLFNKVNQRISNIKWYFIKAKFDSFSVTTTKKNGQSYL